MRRRAQTNRLARRCLIELACCHARGGSRCCRCNHAVVCRYAPAAAENSKSASNSLRIQKVGVKAS